MAAIRTNDGLCTRLNSMQGRKETLPIMPIEERITSGIVRRRRDGGVLNGIVSERPRLGVGIVVAINNRQRET